MSDRQMLHSINLFSQIIISIDMSVSCSESI